MRTTKQEMSTEGQKSLRDSNLELYRIIVMFAIVAHHYVVNSGLMDVINNNGAMRPASLFLLLYGCWGKIGINCFVLITGYFMCKSNITLKKFLKLFLEWMFYKYVIWAIFLLCGYRFTSLRQALKSLLPIASLTDGFNSCYIVFFLFIPFLNILIRGINQRYHQLLLLLSLGVFSALGSVIPVGSSYVIWFINLYFLSSYIRLYPIPLFENVRFWGWMSLLAVACAYGSVTAMAWIKDRFGFLDYYYFLADSNKITALAVALSFFLCFKNWKVKYSKTINTIASSTFGVLCIHAHSDTMRSWLWETICRNTEFYGSAYLVIHAFGVVIAVYAVCTVIDQIRIRFVETPVFHHLKSHGCFGKG